MPVPIGHRDQSHNRLALPDRIPGKDRCVKVWVPDERRYNDYLIGALNRLATWIIYEPDDNHTAALVAQEWRRSNSKTFRSLDDPCASPPRMMLPAGLYFDDGCLVIDECQLVDDLCVKVYASPGGERPTVQEICYPPLSDFTEIGAVGAAALPQPVPPPPPEETEVIGAIIPHMRATLPAHWLPLDGGTYNAAAYPELWEVLAPSLKDDETETFTLPDMSAKFPIGTNSEFDVGASGGSESVTLSVDNLPAHDHETANHIHSYATRTGLNIQQGTGSFVTVGSTASAANTGAANVDVLPTGGGQAFSIMPPYRAMRFAIVAKKAEE